MLVESIPYKGKTIEIHSDENCESPDTWGNRDAFLVYDHGSFSVERDNFNPETINDHCSDKKCLFYNGYFVFPVFAYIHSGVALSLSKNGYPFNYPFDTSMRGFVLIERQKGTYTRKQAIIVAEGIVKEWNDYLSGNVYGFDTGNDSCWGFYGDYETSGIIEEAKNSIDYEIKREGEKYGVQLELNLV